MICAAKHLARVALVGAVIFLVTLGCGKGRTIPTERRLVTARAVAPALAEPLPDAKATRAVTWGEVYEARARQPELKWSGPFEGRNEERTGLVEVVRRPFDAPRFAFTADFIEADVPTASFLCSTMVMPRSVSAVCAQQLLRVVASEDTLLAYIPTWQADSPIAELRDGVVHSAAIPGLSELRVVTLDNEILVLAKSHWIRARDWTGSALVVLRLAPPLERAGEIPLTETDARDPARVVYSLSALHVADDGLHLVGRRSVRNRGSNDELEGAAIEERWGIGASGKLVRR